MFNWIDRRKKLRREDDVKIKLQEAIRLKHQASLDAIKKLRQFAVEKRFCNMPFPGPERRMLKA